MGIKGRRIEKAAREITEHLKVGNFDGARDIADSIEEKAQKDLNKEVKNWVRKKHEGFDISEAVNGAEFLVKRGSVDKEMREMVSGIVGTCIRAGWSKFAKRLIDAAKEVNEPVKVNEKTLYHGLGNLIKERLDEETAKDLLDIARGQGITVNIKDIPLLQTDMGEVDDKDYRDGLKKIEKFLEELEEKEPVRKDQSTKIVET